MLSEHQGFPTLGVSDMDRARAFYEQTLGFTADDSGMEGVFYGTASTRFLVYQSSYAGTNQATAMAFTVPADAFDAEIADLRTRGITFDEFEAPDVTWTDGVAAFADQRAVWFRDPDGNILSVGTI